MVLLVATGCASTVKTESAQAERAPGTLPEIGHAETRVGWTFHSPAAETL